MAIAVTVIGGYLGAGKTTLVNHILRTADERVAVLVNDFGDITIDQDLITGQDGETISLANGCICCSLVDGFAAALETILALEPQPERLVIEASGVADPASIAAYGHAPGLELDATVVVVDAETIRAKAADPYVGDTVVRQLRSGDIVVLNKVDLVDETELATTTAWLAARIDDALLLPAQHAVVESTVLFGIAEPRAQPAAGESNHRAEDRFGSWTWTADVPVDRDRFERFMHALPETVVRVKGVLFFQEDPAQPVVVQRVGARWSLRPGRSELRSGGVARLLIIAVRNGFDPELLDELAPAGPSPR